MCPLGSLQKSGPRVLGVEAAEPLVEVVRARVAPARVHEPNPAPGGGVDARQLNPARERHHGLCGRCVDAPRHHEARRLHSAAAKALQNGPLHCAAASVKAFKEAGSRRKEGGGVEKGLGWFQGAEKALAKEKMREKSAECILPFSNGP